MRCDYRGRPDWLSCERNHACRHRGANRVSATSSEIRVEAHIGRSTRRNMMVISSLTVRCRKVPSGGADIFVGLHGRAWGGRRAVRRRPKGWKGSSGHLAIGLYLHAGCHGLPFDVPIREGRRRPLTNDGHAGIWPFSGAALRRHGADRRGGHPGAGEPRLRVETDGAMQATLGAS